MTRAGTVAVMLIAALGSAPAAGQSATTASGQNAVTPRAQEGRQTAAATARSAAQGRQPINVKLELMISDQAGMDQPVRKTVTMLMADGYDGRVRSGGMITDSNNTPRYNVQLNADAYVELLASDKVLSRITVEYSAARSAGAQEGTQPLPPSGLNETVTVVLANGKPTVITQSADPSTDRKVVVEATATIIR